MVPDVDGNIICFPFYNEDGHIVAMKYRGPNKQFWQRKGGKRIFYNLPALYAAIGDVDTVDGKLVARSPHELIIVEGEIDALTMAECGYEYVVSVPDGAPAVRGEEASSDMRTGKFSFLYESLEELSLLRKIMLAVDNDEPGQLLAEEIIRRIGKSRSWAVKYPNGCKDPNDVLMKHSKKEVASFVENATCYPVNGVYRLSDYPNLPPLTGYAVSRCNMHGKLEHLWFTLDDLLKVFPGEMMVLTGIPGHGKSSFALNLVGNLYDTYRWRAAVFSPEMRVVPYMRDKLRSMVTRKSLGQLTAQDIRDADDWIDDALVFLDEDPNAPGNGEDHTLDWVLNKATEAVLRDGIRVLLIDPWNEVEHKRNTGELETAYIGRGLRDIRQFAQRHGVLCIIVAHPTKEVFEKGGKGKAAQVRPPSAYDIDGSAHWYNKPDHVLCVYRESKDTSFVTVHVRKVRFSPETGRLGEVRMQFNTDQQRFLPLRSDQSPLDM